MTARTFLTDISFKSPFLLSEQTKRPPRTLCLSAGCENAVTLMMYNTVGNLGTLPGSLFVEGETEQEEWSCHCVKNEWPFEKYLFNLEDICTANKINTQTLLLCGCFTDADADRQTK